jgi:hypothetical protein
MFWRPTKKEITEWIEGKEREYKPLDERPKMDAKVCVHRDA